MDDNGNAEAPKSEQTTSSAPSPKTSPALDAAKRKAKSEASTIRDAVIPSCLHTVIGAAGLAEPYSVKVYLESFVQDARATNDPVERMMLEQMALAHYQVAKLHSQAAQSTSPDHTKILTAATKGMLGEFRRLALAVRQYRSPVSVKSFSVIHQQNVASQQEVNFVDKSAAEEERVSFSSRTELEGNPPGGGSDVLDNGEESQTRRGGAGQRRQAASMVG